MWLFAYLSILPLYLFSPLAGSSNTLIVDMAKIYLQYETLFIAATFVVLIYSIMSKRTWQHIRILDRITILLIWATVLSTILAQQIDSLWIANLICFTFLGLICLQIWDWWENFHPTNDSSHNSNGFQPVKTYEQLFQQQKQLADRLVDMIRSQDVNEPLSICVTGKWGSGKTSLVNGVIDKLKEENSPNQYESLYINTMDLDTLSSLFTYVFARIRTILKNRGAYVGIGSEYRRFLTAAIGKITDGSIATLLESRIFPSSDDYRVQMKDLEECISAVLGKDKILVVVDDVERCDVKKAQQFICFIKEIATLRNCVTIFLTDYEYLNQRQGISTTEDSDELKKINYFFYDKFFNYRVDVPPIDFDVVVEWLEQGVREKAKELRFRLPSELFGVFEGKLQNAIRKCQKQVETTDSNKGTLQAHVDNMERLCVQFRSNLALPRTAVKYYHAIENGYSNLSRKYVKNGVLEEKTSQFLSLIRFDEILFLLAYADVCAPYEFLCLKQKGIDYLQCCVDIKDDIRQLLKEMGEDLFYSHAHLYTTEDQRYRYSEAALFTKAYLNGDLPKQVNGFSSRDEMWLHAIKNNNKETIEVFWTEMVQMVAQNFAWRNPKEGEEYLDLLFSFAKENFLSSPGGIEKIFTIFDRTQRNEQFFSSHIAVMKLFWEKFKDVLVGCSEKNVALLEQFSPTYFWHRTSPICSAGIYMAPAIRSKSQNFLQKTNSANEIMLSNNAPTDNLKKLLGKVLNEILSIETPPNDDVFFQLHFLVKKEEEYMAEKELLQYDDIKDQLQLLKTSVEDMECFLALLNMVRENMIPISDFSSVTMLDFDKAIQQFKNALSAPGADKDTSLRMNLQELFNVIRFGDVKLSNRQYDELQNIITESEILYGNMPYWRKILVDHREESKTETSSDDVAQD